MNQDELLERFWQLVIDRAEPRIDLPGARKAHDQADLQLVARSARYDAVFSFCDAFDEAGLEVSAWLGPKARRRWEKLADAGQPPSPRGSRRRGAPDRPFGDAEEAMERLFAAGATPAQLHAVLAAAGKTALEGVRELLRANTFGPDDLGGLHESLLSADPSGREGRPGSWPRPVKAASKAKGKRKPAAIEPGLLLRLKKSFALAFSPDGARIVAASGGAVTDVASGACVATCALLANTSSVTWSPDGRSIAAANTSGKIAICDAATGARRHVLKMTGEGADAVFSPDGARVLAGDWGGHVFAWDAATGAELARIHFAGARVTGVAWMASGLRVLVSHRPEPVESVALSPALVETGRRIKLPPRTNDVVFVEGGAIACGHGWIARLDEAGAVTERCELPGASAVAVSPDGRWLVATCKAGFRIGSATRLAEGHELAATYASGPATFSRDGLRVGLATWNAGTVWELAALTGGAASWPA